MKVLVLGDSCQDVFVYGECNRLAPAAPVPVFVEKYRKSNRGMAGNVWENLKAFGADCDFFANQAEITKTRYVETKTNHMIVRVDSSEDRIDRIDTQRLQKSDLEQYDAVVISDYNKGFLLEEDIDFIAKNHNLVFLDTKKIIDDWAAEVNYIKINEIEYEKTQHSLADKGWIYDKLIVTKGSEGCYYKDKNFPVKKVDIKDLTGAGDTFLSGLVFKYVKTRDIEKSIVFANNCATHVVQLKGVNTINAL